MMQIVFNTFFPNIQLKLNHAYGPKQTAENNISIRVDYGP